MLITNSDGTYYYGYAEDCTFGCAVEGICGTITECAAMLNSGLTGALNVAIGTTINIQIGQ